MSFGSNGVDISLPAAADYSSVGQYRGVGVNSSGQAVLATAAGQSCIGVLQNNPTAAGAASVRVGGVSKMVAGGAVTAGALVKVDASGRAVAATLGTTNTSDAGAANDPAVGSDVLGVALQTASALGDVIGVLVEPRGLVATTAA